MSGGYYDYAYSKVVEFAEQLEAKLSDCAAPEYFPEIMLRLKFVGHLHNVAKAMKAIEWNDSGDGDDEEKLLIEKCLPYPNSIIQKATAGKRDFTKLIDKLVKFAVEVLSELADDDSPGFGHDFFCEGLADDLGLFETIKLKKRDKYGCPMEKFIPSGELRLFMTLANSKDP
jgi:hypothetical protein